MRSGIKFVLLPRECTLVGVELAEAAIDLPSFHHPRSAAYVLGPERGSLSEALQDRCTYVLRIPTRFALNVGIAGAIIMYDRMTSLGRFAPRPPRPGSPTEPPLTPIFGAPKLRRRAEPFRAVPPLVSRSD